MCAYSVFNTFPVYPLSAKPLILLAFCRYRYHTSLFDRPDFQRMQRMSENGKIGTAIVKDLSRFGRNYLDIGKYVEIKYPLLGVRFIAIQENIDTLKNVGTEMSRSTTSSTSDMPRRRARRYAQYGNLRQTRESGIRKQEIRG